MGDVSTPNDEDILLTYGSLYATGDVRAIGDGSFRIVDSVSGAGLLTQNSDPNVVNIDPLTGANAPIGTDVGFGAAVARWVHTGFWNGDFSVPPARPSDLISIDNPLPYWTWTPDASNLQTAQLIGDATYASGYKFQVTGNNTSANAATLSQFVKVPRSQGQQYRALLSLWVAGISGGGNTLHVVTQFYLSDATTTIGSSVSTILGGAPAGTEYKADLGLVPPTASYVKVTITFDHTSGTPAIGEARCAFLAAEATVGLATMSVASTGIQNVQTSVVTATIPANSLVVGARYKVRISGTIVSTVANAVTLRARFGPTTLTGAVITSNAPNATTTASSDGFTWEASLTCYSLGGTGTIYGSSFFIGGNSQPFATATGHSNNTAAVTVDTTVANVLEATVLTGATTTTVAIRDAVIVCERSA